MTDKTGNNQVCIVGGGPAGVMLSLLLSKQGIPVTLLEGQSDFDREFRGDTLHASSIEILDQLGLANSVLDHCNARVEKLQFETLSGTVTLADFKLLDSEFPFVALIPQDRFLNLMIREAEKFPGFQLLMNAGVQDLIRENEKICGVIYQHDNQRKELRACLTVGADGRGSTVRQKAGIKLGKTSPPMDVIWFKLPRDKNVQSQGAVGAYFGSGTMLVKIDRGNEWQMGYVILKGSYKSLREAGMNNFHNILLKLAPELSNSISTLTDWSQCAILSVVTGRVDRWFQSGLLLIGDAAHVMSPIGGVGINYAIQDAVTVANVLNEPLKKGDIVDEDLALVQKQRERAVSFMQSVQTFIQKNIISSALKSEKPFQPPLLLRIFSKSTFFRKKFARFLAYGLNPESLKVA